jgi:DNA invertase Pin-like site-specific DNA recombinase
MKRVAIYIRVSTSKQDTDNQRRELEAVAKRSGWQVVKVFEDAGISGAKGRDQRPGLDAMMKAVNAREFDMVASWSVDRLGRSLTDLLSILQGLHEKGVGLFLYQQGLDTTTTAGKAMFQMLGVFAARWRARRLFRDHTSRVRSAKLQPKDVGSRPNGRSSAAYLAGDLVDGSPNFPGKRIILVAGPRLGTRLHSYATSSPSAPAVVAVNRRLFRAAICSINLPISRSAL